MKLSIKLFLIIHSSLLLQACVLNPKVYQPEANVPQANLIIDLPSDYENTTKIFSFNTDATPGEKLWDNGKSLIYGKDWMLNLSKKYIKINANKPFNFSVFHTEDVNLYCYVYGSFIPQANQTYYLTAGTRRSARPKSFLASVFSPDYGSCFVSVGKKENGHFVAIKLKTFNP